MIICADDYGLYPANDAAILNLAQARRISAISVMLALPGDGPRLPAELLGLRDKLDIGLHLVLTAEGAPLSANPRSLLTRTGTFCSLGELVRRGCCGQIRAADAQAEIQAQIMAFKKRMGCAPAYLDGHLHVQQLPGIRAAVAALSAELCRAAPFYVRNAWTPLRDRVAPLKHGVIAWPGRQLQRLLQQRGVPTNPGFAGIYDYRRWRSFPDYFHAFVSAARHPNAIIMTHPGQNEAWRRMEFETLQHARDISPNRFQHAAPA